MLPELSNLIGDITKLFEEISALLTAITALVTAFVAFNGPLRRFFSRFASLGRYTFSWNSKFWWVFIVLIWMFNFMMWGWIPVPHSIVDIVLPLGHSNELVFVSDREGVFRIYTMDLDGDNVERVSGSIDSEYFHFFPSRRPGKNQIVYTAIGQEGGSNLLMADSSRNITGTLILESGDERIIWYPVWSPGSNRLALLAHFRDDAEYDDYGMRGQIRIISLDGKENVYVNEPELQGVPAWSPDDERIAFSAKFEGQFDVFVRSFDSPNLTRVTDTTEKESYVTWNPVEDIVAYVSQSGVHIVFLEDKASYLIFDTPFEGYNDSFVGAPIAFSPDGYKLAYTTGEAILLYDLSQDKISTLYQPEGSYASIPPPLIWSPDGMSLIFAMDEMGEEDFDIYRLVADASSADASSADMSGVDVSGVDASSLSQLTDDIHIDWMPSH